MLKKNIVLLLAIQLLVTGFQAVQASESSEVNLSTEHPSQSVQVVSYRYEAIYGSVPYQDTCSRQVVSGHTRVCTSSSIGSGSGGGGGSGSSGSRCHTTRDTVCNSHGCTSVPRRSCKSIETELSELSPTDCHDRPTYRTEHYTCTRHRREVVGHRKVKTFNNEIEVLLLQPEEFKGADLKIALNVNEDRVSANLSSSFKQAAVVADVREISAHDQGSEKNSKIQVLIDATISADIIKKIHNVSIHDLSLGYRKIDFSIADASELKGLLIANLDLVQSRKLLQDKVIFSGNVSESALKLDVVGDALKAEIDFGALGVGVKSKSHNVSVKLGVQIPKMINAKDFAAELGKAPSASLEAVYPQ